MAKFKIPVDLIMSKLAEDATKVQTRAQKASEVLLDDLETALAQTPYDVVYQEDRVKLKHYRPRKECKYKTPLLVVYALINRETMLDLQPGRSVVERFLDNGIDLYMIDWGYPTRKDRFLGFDDHINGYMDNIVDFIREKNNVPKVNLMGICMGGAFSVMYSAIYPEKVRNLVTTVTPTNFDTDKGLLHVWMKQLDVDAVVDSCGNLSADMMNFGFLLLNPARLMIDKYVGFMENMDNKGFVENFIRMEKWIFDSPDLPGEVFRQFIRDCYQENKLIQSKLKVGDKLVDLKNITMPLLNIYGKFDHLVPPEACNKLVDAVASKDTEDICLNTGHIGIYVSSKCQEAFAPKIVQWLKDRDEDIAAPVKDEEAVSAKEVEAAPVKEVEAVPAKEVEAVSAKKVEAVSAKEEGVLPVTEKRAVPVEKEVADNIKTEAKSSEPVISPSAEAVISPSPPESEKYPKSSTLAKNSKKN
ncbi:Poly-beta-hydroxybutyrate polymerase (modular protein) [Desulfamplus magnetovallimortis]|uniref:Poly(3-hydroxyalkanoate) polymerase subunit PhaC n=1 Tax=Desulfamplus magnetovallimortis TaxID=1246637 RepID=A0A1W1HIQ9_9BACT|nr:class III poly(R)-hydroxyalkanoic acid synthase subunit PhaC [Desulfamplus magnetovallimortis]SLM32336.1 Poly-beta-hydroxybutyrate polymerase (modular protein) [Desulfamplus magnetovallimortis]